MKKLFFAFVCLLCFTGKNFAATIVFTENMGSISVGTSTPTARTYTGFQNYGSNGITYEAPTGGTTDVRSNSTSSSGYANASGGNFTNLSINADTYFSIKNIPVQQYTGLSLQFAVSKTAIADNGSGLVVTISVDGGTPVNYTPVLPTGAGSTAWYLMSGIVIPNGNMVTINFKTNNSVTSYKIDDVAIVGISTLPVTFGPVAAAIYQNKLNVNWSTNSEINTDHFEIQVATNGGDFKTIALVKSSAENGFSTAALHYSISAGTGTLALTMLLPLLGLGFMFYRKKKSYTQWAIAAAFFVLAYSCSKGNDSIAVPAKDIMVKVVSVDKDGSRQQTPTVKAVQQ